MKFALASAALVASAVSVSVESESVSLDIAYVTHNVTTEVTITSCSDNKCDSTVAPVPLTSSVVTTTVSGVETIYTTVCPESTESAPAPAPSAPAPASSAPASAPAPAPSASAPGSAAPAPAPSASTPAAAPSAPVSAEAENSPIPSGSDVYVDVTSTPVETASTGVELTVTAQSSFTSVYNSASPSAGVSTYAGGANRNAIAGAAGLVGAVALLL